MKGTESQGSSVELRALSKAREALAQGRLDEVARAYLQAARARERAGDDPFRHYLQALEFSSAAGRPQRGVSLARQLLKPKRSRPKVRPAAPSIRGASLQGHLMAAVRIHSSP